MADPAARVVGERRSWQVGINLLADLAAQAVGLAILPPTDLDEAVTIASVATNPQSFALRLCNGTVQVLAFHLKIGFMASALGSLIERTLAPVLDPPNRLPGAVQGLQALDVTVDVATGRSRPRALGDYR
jgi:hypothetical protein